MVSGILGDDNSQLLLFFNSLFITVDISDHRICNLTQLILGITLTEKLPFKPGGNLVPETCRSLMRDVQLPSQHFLCHQGGDFFHAVRNIDTHHWIVILKHPEEIVCRSIYVFLLRLLRLRLSSLSIELLGCSSCILLSQIPDMGYSHVITDSFGIGHIIPIGIVAIIVLVLGEHDTTAALTVNDIKEGYSLLVQLIPDLLTLHFPIVLSGLQGFILLFVQNLTDIFRNIHLHDVPIQVELAIDIHRGGLADIDVRGDNTVGEILDEGLPVLVGQQTGELSVIADGCEEIPGILLGGKGLVEGGIFLLTMKRKNFCRLHGSVLRDGGTAKGEGYAFSSLTVQGFTVYHHIDHLSMVCYGVSAATALGGKDVGIQLTELEIGEPATLLVGEQGMAVILLNDCQIGFVQLLAIEMLPLADNIGNQVSGIACIVVKAAVSQHSTGTMSALAGLGDEAGNALLAKAGHADTFGCGIMDILQAVVNKGDGDVMAFLVMVAGGS